MPTSRSRQDDVDPPGEPGPSRRRRFGPIRPIRTLPGRVYRLARANRGLFVLMILVAGFGSMATLGGVVSLKWSESANFCSRCHTMSPEMKAYKTSPHRDVPCAECHVGPGIRGWVKAKMNGAKQTVEIITGSFPKPIPAPDHAKLPAVKYTCMKCHSLDEIAKSGGPIKMVLRPRYQLDKANTRQLVAVMLRPAGLGEKSDTRGVHWHVQQNVEFARADENSRRIDWVGVKFNDGRSKQFIARKQIGISVNVQQDIERLKRAETTRRMDCIECHNRVGHEIPSPEQAIDESIASGKISRSLPYIKRAAMSRLAANYPSTAAADAAIADIRKVYAARYPLVLKRQRSEVTQAVDELQRLYKLVATPEMKTTAKSFPNNLGHQSSLGCFRCHDGAHYRVVKGQVTKETIPWTCVTCHTFPQIGRKISGVAMLGEPNDHKSKLWVFNHKYKVASVNPVGTSCARCHAIGQNSAASNFCSNCHNTGAAKVNHDTMAYRHPVAIKRAGIQACSYCHQQVFCAKCHRNTVLKPSPTGFFGASPSATAYPLRAKR